MRCVRFDTNCSQASFAIFTAGVDVDRMVLAAFASARAADLVTVENSFRAGTASADLGGHKQAIVLAQNIGTRIQISRAAVRARLLRCWIARDAVFVWRADDATVSPHLCTALVCESAILAVGANR